MYNKKSREEVQKDKQARFVNHTCVICHCVQIKCQNAYCHRGVGVTG